MTDYEKALHQCWENEQGAMAEERPHPSPAFRNVFRQAYDLGKKAGQGEAEVQHVSKFEPLRAKAAIAALQGLLTHKGTFRNTPFNDIPQMAVIMADALLNELVETTEI